MAYDTSDMQYRGEMLITRFEIESVTLGVSLRDCSSRLVSTARARIYDRIRRAAGQLMNSVGSVVDRYGGAVEQVCVSVTPIMAIFDGLGTADYVAIAETLDRATADIGVSSIGGFTALCSKSFSESDRTFIRSIPDALGSTNRLCASVECATSRRGVNLSAVEAIAEIFATNLPDGGDRAVNSSMALIANASGSSPYLPAAFHGVDEPDVALRIAVSGRDVISVPGIAAATTRHTIEQIQIARQRLARGGRFVGEHVAQHITERTGLDVRLDRVEVASVATGDPEMSAAAADIAPSLPLPAGSAVSTTGLTLPIRRLHVSFGTQTAANDLERALIRSLMEGVVSQTETEVNLLPTRSS